MFKVHEDKETAELGCSRGTRRPAEEQEKWRMMVLAVAGEKQRKLLLPWCLGALVPQQLMPGG